MKKKLLISGGCGFVGKNIILSLYNEYDIEVIDNLSSGNKKFLPSNIKIHKIDIKNFDKIKKIFSTSKFEIVIHCAANFANQSSIDNIQKDTRTNILGTINLLEVCKFFKIKKFIYLSSSCIYSSEKSNENILNPSYKTPYAISKFAAEQYVSFYNYYYKLNSSIFRLYNLYGPYDYIGKYRNVLPNFISRALKNSIIEVHGSGSSTRDFTFIFDFIKILKIVIKNPKKYNTIYNFGASDKIKIIDLAKKIIKKTNSRSKIKFIKSRVWDKFSRRKCDNIKIKKEFQNFKFTKIDIGLKYTIDWFKINNKYK